MVLLTLATVVAAVVALATVLTVGAVRAHLGDEAARAVTATLGKPITCTGTTVHVAHGTFGDPEPRIPLIRPVPAMRCTYDLRVVNTGSHTVHLDRIDFSYLGPDSAALTLTGPGVVRSADGIDAVLVLDRDLAAHREWSLRGTLRLSKSSCSETETWLRDSPAITVTAYGKTNVVRGDVALGWTPTRFTMCPVGH